MHDMQNLILAEKNARRGKRHQYGVRLFDKDPHGNLLRLQEMLINKTYNTSPYKIRTIHEPKERLVHCLPYFPDRIAHHAAILQLENMFVSTFTSSTYSCIKNRGIHGLLYDLKSALQTKTPYAYALQLDIRKFYPSIDHDILKTLLRRKIKDHDMLWFLDNVIDSAPGMPIGNYLSSFLSNFYITGFDHWAKEHLGVGPYFRYSDDIVTLSHNKHDLHRYLHAIKQYMHDHLKLTVKNNYRIYPTRIGINIVGYIVYPTHILLRKNIKQNFSRAIAAGKPKINLSAYKGWADHADTKHLLKKLRTIYVANRAKKIQRLSQN